MPFMCRAPVGRRMETHAVVLRGRHVVLEPLGLEHAEGLAEAITPDDDVFRWTNTAPWGEEEMRAWILARNTPRHGWRNLAFAQRDPTTGRLAGSTSLFDWSEKDEAVEIGHTWIAAPWRRTGLNTEAKLLLMRHAFGALRVKRVQLVTDARNERSRNAIARLGAVREGVLRNHRRDKEGNLRNSVYFSVTDAEWPGVEARLEGFLKG
jgi:RimJ/RimL family protein N-acetyltransferase